MADGVRTREVARLLGVELRTQPRWRRQFADDGDGVDRLKSSHLDVPHLQRARIRRAADASDRACAG